MGLFNDLRGTTEAIFQILKGGVNLKNSSGNLLVRNAADSADAQITVSRINVSGQTSAIVLNSDAAGSGADWTITIQVPTSGMTGNYTLTLPVDDGSPGQVLSTDGSGVMSWTSVAGTTDKLSYETTALAFGTSSPVTMFTLPANAVIDSIKLIVDTAFNGTPTATIGVAGNTSKYMGSTQSDLTVAGVYQVNPGIAANGSTEALIITYSAGGASSGAARVLVTYAIPV